MSTFFEDRERAAEYGFSHGEELRFLASREAVETVARWAADALGRSDEAGMTYGSALVGRLVSGAGEADLVAEVQRDLEAGGQPDLARDVGRRFVQASAAASDRLHGRLPPRHERAASHSAAPAAHPHGFWGWTV